MPDTIGRFQVIGELGRGGMAVVYHAHDPEFGRDVAIKMMPREFLHMQGFRERFQREARIIASLEHESIVPVYDYGEQDDLLYLVMRYLPGGSLADRIESEPLSLEETLRIVNRLAPAIDYAHEQGFIHRDLKPDNILFDQRGNPFIADFGIAGLIHVTSQLTDPGSLVGTPAYMSPEQIEGKGDVDARSDLYSLGVILYQMLTGQLPFVADSAVGYIAAHLYDTIPNIAMVRPDLPQPVADVLLRAMDKDKENRYQTAAELAVELSAAAKGVQPTQAVSSLPASGSRRFFYVVVVCGVLLALVLGGILASRTPGRGETSPSAEAEQPGTTIPIETVSADASASSPEPSATDRPAPTEHPLLAELVGAGQIAYGTTPVTINLDQSVNPEQSSDIYLVDADGRDRMRMTLDSARDGSPAWSPDGSQIAFASDRDGDFDIYIMDADGSNLHQLLDEPGDQHLPAWSPDGIRLAFTAETPDAATKNIYTVNADGSGILRLTDDNFTDDYPSWSPDGSQIVFSSIRQDSIDIYTMDADGSNPRSLVTDPFADLILPAWSPDGSRLAYSQSTFQLIRQSTLIVLDMDTRMKTELTPVLSVEVIRPSWSPDGRFIAYSGCSFPSWTCQIYVIDAAGGDPLRIVSTGGATEPAWRP